MSLVGEVEIMDEKLIGEENRIGLYQLLTFKTVEGC